MSDSPLSDAHRMPLNELDVISARLYAENGYPHDGWARLRAEDPVHWCEPEQYRPFWAVTKHADLISVSKNPGDFRSAGRFVLFPSPVIADGEEGADGLVENPPLRMLVNMDPPEHRDYRKLVSGWFTPRAVERLEASLEEITKDIFDDLHARGEVECDFVTEIAAMQPLRMITEILGIPREQEDFVLRVTNENFGLEDPDFQRGADGSEDPLAFITEAFTYLNEITEARRREPRDDLSTVLALATLDGKPVPQFELFSLYFLVMVAGHDTTRNAISSGLLAFLDHPDELEKLRRDTDGLIHTAADEIVRWTTPVNHFSRTATRDLELGGKKIREGDSVALFYASANRDEDVYADPFAFRIDRSPNPHMGFGIGEHYCLGAHLARMDLRVFWRQFAQRVDSIELAGPVELLAASFVGGPKHLPVRIRVNAG
jgi:cytochrome P450